MSHDIMRFLTSEFVSPAHPDKLADAIADSVVDACLAQDRESKVGCEVLLTENQAIVAGEVRTEASLDLPALVQQVMQEADIDAPMRVTSLIRKQPSVLYEASCRGASDQGFCVGYACNETLVYMPLHYVLARNIIEALYTARTSGLLPFLLPDAKAQVTLQYSETGHVERLQALVLSTQHLKGASLESLHEFVRALVPQELLDAKSCILINPGGPFVQGSLTSDTGLTGRKLIVDTYGGAARDGGGSLSGKDPTKIDRCGSYMARFLAKNIVASKLADRCEVELVFGIGIDRPLAFSLNTFGTEYTDKEKIRKIILNEFDLSSSGIIRYLDVKRPIYRQTAHNGHFGKDFSKNPDFTWEKILPPLI